MKLTEDQVAFISQQVEQKGIRMSEFKESLVDHICCAIEADSEPDFDKACTKALAAFGEGELQKLEQEITFLIHKKEIAMKKTMYITGYIAALLSTTGLLFKLLHWPGAMVMLVLGIAVLNFGFLPMYFYNRYKASVSR